MVVKNEPPPDLMVKNVTLFSQGRREHGTLDLHRHHLVFRYSPNSKAGALERGHQRTPSNQYGADSPSVRKSEGNSSIPDDNVSKQRVPPERTVHIAYPLINYCLLRPSHSVSSVSKSLDSHADQNPADGNDDTLFPPTFGTSTPTRPSTDSARLGPYSSPQRATSPARDSLDVQSSTSTGKQPALRLRTKDFKIMAFHFHLTRGDRSPDDAAREIFYMLRSRCCIVKMESIYAFHYDTPKEEFMHQDDRMYDARREFARMGIGGKAAEGPGSAWRITDVNKDFGFSATYPGVLCVPKAVSDNVLKYGGPFRSRCRIPALAYLHPNGGSITRSSQPLVGLQSKRSAQDERLVSAIFASQTPTGGSPHDSPPALAAATTGLPSPGENGEPGVPSLQTSQSDTALDESGSEQTALPRKKIYGSTRQNYIVDARPKINALANRATGGGVEDISNYVGNNGTPIEKIFLNIANIHVMRASLEKVVDSLANSDYLDLKPSQETLRKSGWLTHIAGVLEGSEMVARVVGLGGSHVLVHCSDGWDRTAQVSALAQVMLSPHYRTLDGFITLVQKDFLSFGHKFQHRNGIEGSEKWFEIENERIAPSKSGQSTGSEANSLNNIGAKAFSGAKSWFSNNRSNLFKQQNASRDSVTDDTGSRSASPPPPNPLIHSTPSSNDKRDHKMDEKEVAPIFHQFLDAVYQLMYQKPEAFEFNERFLRRLFYQVYAGQYGEFLFNNEQQRAQHAGRTTSVWTYFDARKDQWLNPHFVPRTKDPLLLPSRIEPEKTLEVRWWCELFGRKDEEMNIPKAASTAKAPGLHVEDSSVSADDVALATASIDVGPSGGVKEVRSTPNLSAMRDTLASGLSGLSSLSLATGTSPKPDTRDTDSTTTPRPPMASQDTDFEVLAKYTGNAERDEKDQKATPSDSVPLTFDMEDGDPLGVQPRAAPPTKPAGLDFAAFASQNAFRDR